MNSELSTKLQELQEQAKKRDRALELGRLETLTLANKQQEQAEALHDQLRTERLKQEEQLREVDEKVRRMLEAKTSEQQRLAILLAKEQQRARELERTLQELHQQLLS
jgi:hypothetical protein